MTAPTTAAGRALLKQSWLIDWMSKTPAECNAMVAAIEAEAVAAYKARHGVTVSATRIALALARTPRGNDTHPQYAERLYAVLAAIEETE